MSRQNWTMALIVLVSVLIGFFLAGSGVLPGAHGQSEGQYGGVICVVGQEFSAKAPVVLIDVPDQTILFYKYDYRNDKVELASARTFKWDKLLQQYENDGPSVLEIRDMVAKQRR